MDNGRWTKYTPSWPLFPGLHPLSVLTEMIRTTGRLGYCHGVYPVVEGDYKEEELGPLFDEYDERNKLENVRLRRVLENKDKLRPIIYNLYFYRNLGTL